MQSITIIHNHSKKKKGHSTTKFVLLQENLFKKVSIRLLPSPWWWVSLLEGLDARIVLPPITSYGTRHRTPVWLAYRRSLRPCRADGTVGPRGCMDFQSTFVTKIALLLLMVAGRGGEGRWRGQRGRPNTTLWIFKVAFLTFWFNPYDVEPSGARHKPRNLT